MRLQGLSVVETPFHVDEGGSVTREYTIHLQFHDMETYPDRVHLSWSELERAVEVQFAKEVERAVVKQFRRAAYVPEIDSVKIAGPSKKSDAEGEGEEAGDAEATKAAAAGGDDAEEDDDENKEVRGALAGVGLTLPDSRGAAVTSMVVLGVNAMST